ATIPFFFQAEDGIRDGHVTGVQTCALPILLARRQPTSSTWQRICNWGKEHFLSQAREAGWVDSLLEQARCHPWHVRTHAFAARWTKEWIVSHSLPYPSLREWERAAARYVTLGGPPGSCFRSSPKPSPHTS